MLKALLVLTAMLWRKSRFRKIGIVLFVHIFIAMRKLISKIAAQIGPPGWIGRGLAFHCTLERVAVVMCWHKSSSMAVVRI